MMAWKVVVRSITLVAAVCCLASLGVGQASAQGASVAVSPGDLSFGVPVSSPQTFVSAQQIVAVAITGSGSATFTNTSVSVTGPNHGDFAVTSNNCIGTFAPPSSCQIGVTFTSTTGATLEIATLSISSTGNPDGLSVSLNGALGAFELFPALNVNKSNFDGITWPNSAGNPVSTASVALVCPANPQARLSSSPDGLNNLFQDNTITVMNKTGPETTVTVSNVCYGGDLNLGFSGFPAGSSNCFQGPYEGAVTGFIGQNPDTAQASNGDGFSPFVDVYGVPPLDLMNPVTTDPQTHATIVPFLPILVQGSQTLTVTLLDAGGFLGSSAVHLVSNCTATGVTTGGTVLAPPIDPNSPGSLSPTFPFNNTNGQHILFGANYLNGENTTTFSTNTVPQVADTAVPQASFPALVAGTSAGPSVCMRFNGELDANNLPQCKAFTITCTITNPNGTTSSASGTNCPQSSVRNILFKTLFDSPDTPTSQSQIAPGTGPGFLMGTDTWGNTTCTFTDPNLLGEPCPQDILTSFIGGDPAHGGTTRSTNSTFVAVLNMPLPSTDTDLLSENFFGWQQSKTVNVRFEASPATYPVRANRHPLPANGFSPAPIQNVTFGTNSVTATPAVPDPTFPVKNDVMLPNGTCPNAPAGTFTQTQTLTTDTSTGNPFAEGRYNLHYFATDCASTEELRFIFNTSPTANWASFKTKQIRIDHTAPSITATNVTFASGSKSNTVSVTLKCVDPVLAGDGTPGSGVVICGPALFFAAASTPSFRVKIPVGKTTHGSFQLPTFDLAFNTRTVTVNY